MPALYRVGPICYPVLVSETNPIRVTIPGRHQDLLENVEPPNGVLLTCTARDSETVLEVEILGRVVDEPETPANDIARGRCLRCDGPVGAAGCPKVECLGHPFIPNQSDVDDAAGIRRAAAQRGQSPEYSYDDACRRGMSYQGYGLDELLRTLLLRESLGQCDQCGVGDCTHQAATLVLSEMYHPFGSVGR